MKSKQELIRYWSRWYFNKNKSGSSNDKSKGVYTMKESYELSEVNFKKLFIEYFNNKNSNIFLSLCESYSEVFENELRIIESIERNKKLNILI